MAQAPETLTDKLYKVVAQYLEAHGWKPLVIGGCIFERRYLLLHGNYEFIVHFTGGRASEQKSIPEMRRHENDG